MPRSSLRNSLGIITILKQIMLFDMAHLNILHIIFLLAFAAHFNPLQLLLVDVAAADQPQHLDDLADGGAFTNSSLELKVGLNLSVAHAFNKSSQLPISSNTMFSIAVPAINSSWFLPIISSPSFKSSNASESRGFSFGFFFQVLPVPGQLVDSINVYLGVCGGISGNFLSNSSDPNSAEHRATLRGSADSHTLYAPTVLDGGAVLVWHIKPSTPLTSYGAYLQVVENNMPTTNSNQLELRDYDGTLVWNVSNVGLMEIQDSGALLIYESINKSQVVWKSGPRDTLFLGEKLAVGEQLTSSTDSSYSLRMEEGGLVLYLNTMQFMDEHPAPYWAIPILLNPTLYANTLMMNISKQVFFSSPCTKGAAYAKLEGSIFFGLKHSFGFILDPGTCSNNTLGINTEHSASPTDIARADHPFSFVKLEDDGWLHSYAVSPTDMSFVKLEDWDSFFYFDTRQPSSSSYSTPVSILQVSLMDITCAVPNQCGPLGLCTPFATNCSCPPSFNGIDTSNANAGCARITPLPDCTKDEHVHTTEYVSLNHTATSFLFSGWAFASISGTVEFCKMSCSANCSCSGFFYEGHTFSCFFITITDEMSLLNMTLNLTAYGILDIEPSNYVTYLKVKSDGSPSGHAKSSTVIAITVVSSLAVCLGLGLAVYVFYSRARMHRSQREKAVQAAELEEELRDVIPLLPSRFSFQDLYRATEGFSKLLGAGACGSVYFGILEDRRKVAVKTLESTMKGDQSKQFLAEVATIGQTCHHNVVRLIGFCWEVSSRSLVYEYMERGSLDHWLFVKPSPSPLDGSAPPILDWQTRYSVVLGIARGLRYLHEECPQPILHFDIKPQNILLDDYFVPKLADFGMSRLMQRDISKVITGIRGTPGYIAPEWVLHGEVSKKSDVYSMGMVMLEIVGGRRNLDLELRHNNSDNSSGRHHEAWYFPSWAAGRCEQGLEMEVVDNRLQGAFEMEQARRLIYAAFWCIQEDPEMRPYVPIVVQWLEGMSPVRQPPFSSVANVRYSRSSKPSSKSYSVDVRPSSWSFTASSSGLST